MLAKVCMISFALIWFLTGTQSPIAKESAQKIFDAIRPWAENNMISILVGDASCYI